VVENIENLLGSQGGENLKLIYQILKRGNKLNLDQPNLTTDDIVELGLRYDLTIPLSRFYCNNRHDLPSLFKSIQVGNVFRAERSQKGRYRSFKQCDIDIIGNASIDSEIELLTVSAKALLSLEVSRFEIKINDRRILRDVILYCGFEHNEVENICITLDKLDKIGLSGIEKELRGKNYPDLAISKILKAMTSINQKGLPSLYELGVAENIISEIQKLVDTVNELSNGDYQAHYDFTLVRGMGYYTGPIFEIVYKDLGYSIAGGGRYDKMIGDFIGEDIPAVGFSIGFERLVNQLIEEGFNLSNTASLVLIYDDADSFVEVFSKADALRSKGHSVSIMPRAKKLNKQLSQLKAMGYNKFCVMSDLDDTIKSID
jgi:histidyl-tRNA synthetase